MSSPTERFFGSMSGRLIVILCGGLLALMTALFVLLDYGIDRQIYGRLDAGLLARARAVAALFEAHPRAEALDELHALMPGFAGGNHADFMQMWDLAGRALLVSGSNADAALRPPSRVPANAPVYYDLPLPDGHRGRGVALRVGLIDSGGTSEAVLAVAEEREQVDALERRVHYALLAGIFATAIAAAALAIAAVRRGLRPLLVFGDEAARCAPEPSPLPPPRTLPVELRPFAHALEDAFTRLHGALERERLFARDVAHELRTPLAEIRAAVELARRDAHDAAPLDGALASVERMRRCIDSLLALSRYESGMAEPQLEPMDFAAALRDAIVRAAPAAAARQVNVEVAVPPEWWLLSDPVLVERILDNLLLNAAEYAPARSTVQVRVAPRGDETTMRVGNDAPELQAEDVAHLGERFWRKSAAREAASHGGLGLALARTLADVLGLRLGFSLEDGRLWAELGPLRPIAAADAVRS